MTCGRCGAPLDGGRCPSCASTSGAVPSDAAPPGMVPFNEWVGGQEHHGGEHDAGRGQHESEVDRLAGRRTAMLCAATWSAPFLLAVLIGADFAAGTARTHYINQAIAGGALTTEPHPPPPYGWYAVVPALMCWAASAVAELLLARRLAGAYPALGPWAWLRSSTLPQRARRALSGLDRRLTGASGCAALIGLAVAGPLFILGWMFATAAALPLWLLVVLAFTAAHLLSVRRRSQGTRPTSG